MIDLVVIRVTAVGSNCRVQLQHTKTSSNRFHLRPFLAEEKSAGAVLIPFNSICRFVNEISYPWPDLFVRCRASEDGRFPRIIKLTEVIVISLYNYLFTHRVCIVRAHDLQGHCKHQLLLRHSMLYQRKGGDGYATKTSCDLPLKSRIGTGDKFRLGLLLRAPPLTLEVV